MGGKTWDEWIAQYATSHQHPINRFCHTLGIPLIVIALVLAVPAFFIDGFWPVPAALFVVGWLFQFIGHAFEGKTSRVLSRLALSPGRPAVVGRQDPRSSLK